MVRNVMGKWLLDLDLTLFLFPRVFSRPSLSGSLKLWFVKEKVINKKVKSVDKTRNMSSICCRFHCPWEATRHSLGSGI